MRLSMIEYSQRLWWVPPLFLFNRSKNIFNEFLYWLFRNTHRVKEPVWNNQNDLEWKRMLIAISRSRWTHCTSVTTLAIQTADVPNDERYLPFKGNYRSWVILSTLMIVLFQKPCDANFDWVKNNWKRCGYGFIQCSQRNDGPLVQRKGSREWVASLTDCLRFLILSLCKPESFYVFNSPVSVSFSLPMTVLHCFLVCRSE